MASYLDKFKVATAIKENTKFDLSCQHITSSDFFQLAPIYSKEMVPGEKISINVESFTRLAPLAVPTFGRVKMKNRAFFVPFRTIFKGWNDFITDTTHVYSGQSLNTNAIGSKVPYFQLGDLAYELNSNTWRTEIQVDGDGNPVETPDIVFTTQDGTKKYGRWLPEGRQLVKILQSLGYVIPNNYEAQQSTQFVEVSALPLLAFAKIYCDWYFPAQYYDTPLRTNLERFFKYDEGASGMYLSSSELHNIFQVVTSVNYDSDYFVSAFDNPVGPNNNSYTQDVANIFDGGNVDSSIDVSTNLNSKVMISGINGTPVLRSNDTATTTTAVGARLGYVSQLALTGLYRLTDYMKRHQLVGARALDRYLARFGKALTAEKMDRSNYIGSQEVPIQIGDVMNNATTGSDFATTLGGFAGKGIGYSGDTFEYSTDEYGIVMILSSIVPTVGYYQGIDRNVMHTQRTDFWTPEFDQLGNQAIKASELYWPEANNDDDAVLNGLESAVFGWTPRYAEYKIGRDKLTGDWRIPTLNGVGPCSDSWHLMRKIDPDAVQDLVHDYNFVKGDLGGNSEPSQYNRIFQYSGSTDNKYVRALDHFYVIHNFNVVSWSPMCALYDTYEFEHDKGKMVTADVNGVKVN